MRLLLIGIAVFFSVLTGCQSDNSEEVVNEHGDIQNLEALDTFVERIENEIEAEIEFVDYGVEGQRVEKVLRYEGEKIDVSQNIDGEAGEEYNCEDIKIETEKETKRYVLKGCSGNNDEDWEFELLSIPTKNN